MIRRIAVMTLFFLLAGQATVTLADSNTRVVILGTGTPVPDHTRAGAGVAVIHNGEAYLFDVGDGVVMRAMEAADTLGIEELSPTRIKHVFFTHLHSDHIHDYSVLASALWWRRSENLQSWGPEGLQELTHGMQKMLDTEARIRAHGTPPQVISNPQSYRVKATEIQEGVVFRKGDLTIEAFTALHGDIKPAFSYKITTNDKSIVISGDTSYNETLIEKAKGVDILIHEVISMTALAGLSEFWQQYHNASHTTTEQLADIANKARPGTLVLYHMLFYSASAAELLREVKNGYDGDVVLARDLQVF